MIPPTTPSPTSVLGSRGAFVLLEGVDRCGKTTQCRLLLKHLLSIGIAAISMQFPNRSTAIGKLIDSYLKQSEDQDDHAIHLLFSANRWEATPQLKQSLASGQTVICDRYAYSGVAFSAAKQDDGQQQVLDLEWCKKPDVGLPAPDVVIFLDLSQEEAEKRGGYGGERYEKRDMQARVRQQFSELQASDARVPWHVVNAAQSMEEVQAEINDIVQDTLIQVQQGNKPLYAMWDEAEIELEANK